MNIFHAYSPADLLSFDATAASELPNIMPALVAGLRRLPERTVETVSQLQPGSPRLLGKKSGTALKIFK